MTYVHPRACANAASARSSAVEWSAWSLLDHSLQRGCGSRDRCPVPRSARVAPIAWVAPVEPDCDLLRLHLRQRPVQCPDRDGSIDRLPPRHVDVTCRSRTVTRMQECHDVAQIPCPFGTSGEGHAGFRCAQGQTLSEQGLGDVVPAQHKMQMREGCPGQKRHIFRGFGAHRRDPGGHPG